MNAWAYATNEKLAGIEQRKKERTLNSFSLEAKLDLWDKTHINIQASTPGCQITKKLKLFSKTDLKHKYNIIDSGIG